MPHSQVTLSNRYLSSSVTANVSAIALAKNVMLSGPANSNITFNREYKELRDYHGGITAQKRKSKKLHRRDYQNLKMCKTKLPIN